MQFCLLGLWCSCAMEMTHEGMLALWELAEEVLHESLASFPVRCKRGTELEDPLFSLKRRLVYEYVADLQLMQQCISWIKEAFLVYIV